MSVVRGPLRGSNGLRIHKDRARDPRHLSRNLMIGSDLTTDNRPLTTDDYSGAELPEQERLKDTFLGPYEWGLVKA